VCCGDALWLHRRACPTLWDGERAVGLGSALKIYGLVLVKDEVDVVGQAIRHALGFCDRIAVLDNGSGDGTPELIEELASEYPGRVIFWGIERCLFRRSLRGLMYDELRHELGWDDWFLQLDSDEFMASDPTSKLAEATASGFDVVRTWQAQFRFTKDDLAEWEAGRDDPTRPIEQRRRYYSVDWREARFFRNRPDRAWEGTTRTIPDWATTAAPFSLVNRHYQYRDPAQIQHRLDVRAAARSDYAFTHVTNTDWRSEVVPTFGLRHWDVGTPIQPRAWRYYARQARRLVRV
jgi:hypothetical protein